MTDCCTNNSGKSICPECGQMCNAVSLQTVLQHISSPWEFKTAEEYIFFCNNPACETIYFTEGTTVFRQDKLRTKVGIKSASDESIICYCYGINRRQAKDKSVKAFVIEQTKLKQCACSTRNPSGKCCLKDFPHSKKEDK